MARRKRLSMEPSGWPTPGHVERLSDGEELLLTFKQRKAAGSGPRHMNKGATFYSLEDGLGATSTWAFASDFNRRGLPDHNPDSTRSLKAACRKWCETHGVPQSLVLLMRFDNGPLGVRAMLPVFRRQRMRKRDVPLYEDAITGGEND